MDGMDRVDDMDEVDESFALSGLEERREGLVLVFRGLASRSANLRRPAIGLPSLRDFLLGRCGTVCKSRARHASPLQEMVRCIAPYFPAAK
jgi:hypothetical protein